MIYLASPYSHPDADIRQERFDAACRAAAELMQAGHIVYSPVVHGHPIAQHGLATDWAYWERTDRRFIETCDEVVVLTLDGWRVSEGVQAEIQIARELGKPVAYRPPVLQVKGRRMNENWDKAASFPVRFGAHFRLKSPTMAHVRTWRGPFAERTH